MKARELATILNEHPEAEVTLVGNYGEAGFGHNAAPIYEPTIDFTMVSWMGCPNPETTGKPTFSIRKGKMK